MRNTKPEEESIVLELHVSSSAGSEYGDSFDASFEDTADALVWTDKSKSILACNETTERLLGYSRDELKGRNLQLFFAGDIPKVRESHGVLIIGNGRQMEADVFISTVRDGRKNPTGFVVRIRKTTPPAPEDQGHQAALDRFERERQEREEDLKQMAQIEKLAAMAELSSKITHDISSPLTAILGYAQVLAEGTEDQSIQEGLDIIQEQAKRIHAMALDISSMVRKQRPPCKSCVSVNAVVESALQLRDSELRRNRVEVELVLEPDLPDVLVDPQQLQQVFLNLIDNAVQAMAESHTGGRLTVGTSRVDHHLRITFTDDGPGIPSKLRDQVFESFFTTAEDSQRLGLGLAICRRLLRSHGGSIRAEDSDGCGAILVIELPILSA